MSLLRTRLSFLRCVFLVVCLASGVAGERPAADSPRVAVIPRERPQPEHQRAPGNIRLDVNLVQIPVTVTDAEDRPVMGLRKEDFRIFEDNVEQEITTFTISDAPASIGIVFDSSRSMKNRIADSRMAVGQFLETTSPGDEYLLIKFSDKAELAAPFTHSIDAISERLNFVEAHGWTALIDAIYLGTQHMRRAENPRKVLLVLSDGGDNNSRYSGAELLSVLKEADIRVFAISLFERPQTLEKICDETGGHVVWVRKLADLPDAMETLGSLIRSQYVLGYGSKQRQNDGRYHRVRVQLQPALAARDLRASWRRGYLAPNE